MTCTRCKPDSTNTGPAFEFLPVSEVDDEFVESSVLQHATRAPRLGLSQMCTFTMREGSFQHWPTTNCAMVTAKSGEAKQGVSEIMSDGQIPASHEPREDVPAHQCMQNYTSTLFWQRKPTLDSCVRSSHISHTVHNHVSLFHSPG